MHSLEDQRAPARLILIFSLCLSSQGRNTGMAVCAPHLSFLNIYIYVYELPNIWMYTYIYIVKYINTTLSVHILPLCIWFMISGLATWCWVGKMVSPALVLPQLPVDFYQRLEAPPCQHFCWCCVPPPCFLQCFRGFNSGSHVCLTSPLQSEAVSPAPNTLLRLFSTGSLEACLSFLCLLHYSCFKYK